MGALFTQGHALVVGVGADLPYTANDAAGIAKILRDPDRCGYPEHQVKPYCGPEATRDRILSGLDDLAGLDAESTVVIYFSGHGYRVSGGNGDSYFLLPYKYDTNKLETTAISSLEFEERLHRIKVKGVLVILDCCHAGGINVTTSPAGVVKAPPGVEMVKAPLPPEAPSLFARGSGKFLLASSRAEEVSYAGRPYSAFTATLIEALCGAGSKAQDGYVRLSDLVAYTSQKVPERTRDRQHPNTDFVEATNFALAYYAGGGLIPKGPPTEDRWVEAEREPGEWNPAPRIEWDITAAVSQVSGRDSYHAGRDFYRTESGDINIAGRDVIKAGRDLYMGVRNAPESQDALATIFTDANGRAAGLPDHVSSVVKPILNLAYRSARGIESGEAVGANQAALKGLLKTLLGLAPELGKFTVAGLAAPTDGLPAGVQEVARSLDS